MISHHLRAGALLFAVSLAAAAPAHAQGKWRAGAPIPQGANEVLGGAIDGQMFVYGGRIPRTSRWASSTATTLPRTNGRACRRTRCRCTMAPPPPSAASSTCSADSACPTPASSAWYPENKAWVFDLDTQKWSALPNMPTARGALAAVAVGKKIYVVGGASIPTGTQMPDGLFGGGPVELLGTTRCSTPTPTPGRALAPMPTPRNHHSVAYADGKIYAIGGRVGSCFSAGWSSNIWMNDAYDIATNTWTPRAPMPTARSGTGIAVVDGKIHVLGGEGWIEDFGGVFRAHEVYDPKTNTWARYPRMITPRHGFAAAEHRQVHLRGLRCQQCRRRRHPVGGPGQRDLRAVDRIAMRRTCILALALAAAVPAAAPPAAAQDVQGIELCTRETRMDRRTGCLQSNIEYLQQLIAKNALDAQQKLAAANREIAAQKDAAAAAAREITTLRDALAELKARMDQTQRRPELTPAAAAATKEIAALRDALAELKARMDQTQKAKPEPAPAKPGSK